MANAEDTSENEITMMELIAHANDIKNTLVKRYGDREWYKLMDGVALMHASGTMWGCHDVGKSREEAITWYTRRSREIARIAWALNEEVREDDEGHQ